MRFALLIVLLVTWIVAISCSDGRPNDLKFDSSAWKSGDTRLRGQMYRDILRTDLIARKSRTEVLELLGPATRDERENLSYEIDLGDYLKFISVSRFYLIISFDSSGAVAQKASMADG